MNGPLAIGSAGAALALVLASCASEPLDMSLAAATSQIDVTVLGDGFVRTGARRLPQEAFVLELRQKTRAMSREARAGLRVVIAADDRSGDDAQPDIAADVATDVAWLIDQLGIMKVEQVQYVPGPR
jgi:hypothetical protein